MENFKYFRTSLLLMLGGIIAGFYLGGIQAAVIVGVLCVLEISLSFDNAVVNATVLKDMAPKWRKAFLTWGMLIAVFGMRVVFPVAIVAVAAKLGPIDAVTLALSNEEEYSRLITEAHHQIAAFGGAFLMMVFLKFFVDQNKEHHWIGFLEKPLLAVGRIEMVEIAIVLGTIVGSSYYFGNLQLQTEFVIAGIWGLVAYVLADGLGGVLGGESGDGAQVAAKSGAAGFLYLELLDASFSFDGVVGAFALTKSLPIIAIGLGIGAMFVRSFTIMLVDKGTLSAYKFLEHGAFWAIGALALVMLVGVHIHIPEVVTGLVGAVLIGLSFWSSLRAQSSAKPVTA